jgi:hypothetical protein
MAANPAGVTQHLQQSSSAVTGAVRWGCRQGSAVWDGVQATSPVRPPACCLRTSIHSLAQKVALGCIKAS